MTSTPPRAEAPPRHTSGSVLSTISRNDRILGVLAVVVTAAAAVARNLGNVAAFILAGIALAILAACVGRAVDALGDRVGAAATGILQSALGNLPELLILIFALHAGLIGVVQATIVGSILANVALVLGVAFIAGGLRHGTQRFSGPAARDLGLSLLLAVAALSVPSLTAHLHTPAAAHERVLSEIVSVVLILAFALSVVAALRPNRRATGEPATSEPATRGRATSKAATVVPGSVVPGSVVPGSVDPGSVVPGSVDPGSLVPATVAPGDAVRTPSGHSAESEAESAEGAGAWPLWLAVAVLAVTGVLAALVSDWFVAALQPAMNSLHINDEFAGLVIVAIAGNAVENFVGIQLALKNRAEHALQVVLQSPLQIAMVVAPVVLLASPLLGAGSFTLVLSPLLLASLLISALIAVFITFDGESTWYEGVVLVALYALLAASFWWG